MSDYPVVIEEIQGFRVVRDDLIPGGTKVRAIDVLFDDEHEEYVYAGPCQGYAQVALAYACRAHGKLATIVCAKRDRLHERTKEAIDAGALVYQIPAGRLNVIQARAREYCRAHGAILLPWGLADARVVARLAGFARSAIMLTPTEVWTVAGSGTLSLALQEAWPDATVHAVMVGKQHERIGRAILHTAPELYEQPAKRPPPFPSCDNYDAKLWQFVIRHATPGALVWNVAK